MESVEVLNDDDLVSSRSVGDFVGSNSISLEQILDAFEL